MVPYSLPALPHIIHLLVNGTIGADCFVLSFGAHQFDIGYCAHLFCPRSKKKQMAKLPA
jgi:hypothetical protein